jgi:polyvinyl alcohol dehydrogenase (cytochrome)
MKMNRRTTLSAFSPLIAAGIAMFAVSAFSQTSDYRAVWEFQEYCAACHETPAPGTRAPSRAELKAMSPTKIYHAMTVGKMQPNAEKLSDKQKRRVAEWLSGRPLVEIDRSAAGMANACSSEAQLDNPLAGSGWVGWSPDATTSSRYQSAGAAGLSVADVSKLELKWAFGLPGAGTLRSQPVVGGGWLWVGSDNGMVYALDAGTGCVHWSFEAQRPVVSSVTVGPLPGSPGHYAVYFGDFGANVYALDAESGEQLWTTRVDDHHATAISGSVVLTPSGDRLVVPVGSWEEPMSASPTYECCTSRGAVAVLDSKTGAQLWKTYTLAEQPRPVWKNSSGVQQYGPSGAGVWSSPTIDTRRNAVYVGTSNSYIPVPDGGASDAVLAFDLDDGKMLWSRQLLENDANDFSCGDAPEQYQKNCPGKTAGPNDDIGAPPIIHTLESGRQVVIASQESRRISVLDPDRNGDIIWQGIPSARATSTGGNLGPAIDDKYLYVPLGYKVYKEFESAKGLDVEGGLVAVDPETGQIQWTTVVPRPSDCPDPASSYCTSANQAAVTAIPGVVFTGSVDGTMRAYSSADGAMIWSYSSNRPFDTVNGIEARGGSVGGPGPTIVDGMVYWGSGYAILGTTAGNVLLAFHVASE